MAAPSVEIESIEQIAATLDKAFKEQDVTTIANYLHSEFRLQHYGPAILLPIFGEFNKETYFTVFAKEFGELFQPIKFELKDRFAHDDKVYEHMRWTVVARKTGKTIETPYFAVSRYEGGKVIEMEMFTDSHGIVQALQSV